MSFRSRARFGLLAILFAIPLATAKVVGLPGTSDPQADVDTSVVPAVGTDLDIQEDHLTFLGPANSPTLVTIRDAEGATLVEYRLDADGRARLDVAGQNAVTDATFVRLEGEPTEDSFTVVLRDAEGRAHELNVRRTLLNAGVDAPSVEAPVEITRPFDWPGAPQRPYLLHVRDSAMNLVAGAQLNGDPYLQKAGAHRAVLQIPHNENEWDRWFVQARREGQSETLNATFAEQHTTDDVLVLAADFAPSLLGPAEGERIQFDVVYERRLTPLLVERYLEPATYSYRVDGRAPTVSINAPSSSIDFRFTVTWAGGDDLSGMGHFVLYHRESGTSQWVHWLTTPDTAAIFSGAWGKTYELRLRALDKVGNPSQDVFATTTVASQPSGEDDVNDPPTARLLSPFAGSVLSSSVPISWQAGDPDGTPVTSRLEVSSDDGETYRLLYVGPDQRATWDTTSETDGPGYRLRLTVSDGTQTVQDTASALKVRNIVAPPPPDEPAAVDPTTPSAPVSPSAPSQPATGGADDEPVIPAEDGGAEPSGKRVPAPFVGIAIGLAALLAGRRRQRG